MHVLTRFLDGGTERNVGEFMDWEVTHGHDVHLIVGAESRPERISSAVRVHVVPNLQRAVAPVADARAYRRLSALLGTIEPDVLFTHQAKAGILAREAARDGRCVRVHSLHGLSFGPGYGRMSSLAFRLAERHAARHTDLFLSVGAELRDRHVAARIGKPAMYTVVPSPIPVDRALQLRDLTPAQHDSERQALGLRKDARLLVAIGALEPRKRIVELLDWLAPLLADHRHVLAIVGRGPDAPRISERASELGLHDAVALTGWTAEPWRYLAAANALVHASRSEGLSQVIVLACAANVPVVSTDVCGVAELHGANVRVAEPGEPFARATRAALDEPPQAGLPPEAFLRWTPEAVRTAIQAFHEGPLAEACARRLSARAS